jgi:methylated-DNA-[protein]-cysteine S-methyltransferase
MNELCYDLIESPIGTVVIVCGRDAMRSLHFLDRKPDAADGATRVDDPLGYSTRLRAYFDRDVAALDGIAVDPGGTPFQQLVWTALRNIPAGRTESYGHIAQKIGRPSACRAVGLANGQNPISLVIPCHRVIGSNGKLTGYGGGLHRKEWLLEHERAQQSMKLYAIM